MVDERASLELPPEPAPQQGAVLETVATLAAPAAPREEGDFDEAGYLGRQGIHVILRANSFRVVGRRGGLGGLGDRLRDEVSSSLASGSSGEPRAVLAGVVLGEDEGLDTGLRDSFRASGLYHLLRKFKSSTGGEPPRRLPQVDNSHAAVRRDGGQERNEQTGDAASQTLLVRVPTVDAGRVDDSPAHHANPGAWSA